MTCVSKCLPSATAPTRPWRSAGVHTDQLLGLLLEEGQPTVFLVARLALTTEINWKRRQLKSRPLPMESSKVGAAAALPWVEQQSITGLGGGENQVGGRLGIAPL